MAYMQYNMRQTDRQTDIKTMFYNKVYRSFSK